jgi:hypothetical protein
LQERGGNCEEKDSGKTESIPMANRLMVGRLLAVLPLMAGFACQHDFWKFGLVGGIVFTVTAFLFTSVTERLQTGPKARGALLFTCLGIWLASQCFAGIIL